MVDTKLLVSALVFIPLLLLISTAVFQDFAFNSRDSFEGSEIVNESIGVTGAGTGYTDYPAKVDTATIYNGTSACGSACTIDYYTGLQKAKIVSTATGGAIKVTYTPYSATGYTSWTSIFTQTFAGLKLGGMMPFVLIAVAVLLAIFGTFGISKLT